MTEPSEIKALIGELERGLEGVTGGEWHIATGIMPTKDIPPSVVALSDPTDLRTIKRIADVGTEINARHIARCSPDNIRRLIAALREAQAAWELENAGHTALQEAVNEFDNAEAIGKRALHHLRNYRNDMSEKGLEPTSERLEFPAELVGFTLKSDEIDWAEIPTRSRQALLDDIKYLKAELARLREALEAVDSEYALEGHVKELVDAALTGSKGG
jgi:hypothetical protein